MLTSKQRSRLRGLANTLTAVTQVGKAGITPALVYSLSQSLEAHELIKVSVLESSGRTAEDVLRALAEELSAEPVQAVGAKITLYRRSSRKDIEHLQI